MCTVTIIPNGSNDFVLTSNRDEAPDRISIAPEIYSIANTKALFPKDVMSNGTWIGLSEKNRLVCVLNGGFKYHERKTSYRLSRGIVAKDLMVAGDLEQAVDTYDLMGVEPFTMVIVDWDKVLKFYELVWDGEVKHFKSLPLEPAIWSSSTLYTASMKAERLRWFEAFKQSNSTDAPSLLAFHKTAGKGNLDYGVVMDRGIVKTTSITQVVKCGGRIEMHYEGLETNLVVTKEFNLSEVVND
ncbi:NRDE family protein [Snuella sedimenti]|uniref:NRDE family protein n=1 Tax=Snuella sedimenti TaxID=2798802 RepID=A0A8J7J040_9FLAO|nr:NRDE family protein [Snuella sedimenti]MBJ6366524.1 NRDE family protein [Snuella sedimenti]